MADDYLNFHKLEATELPFTVARVVDEDLQSSPECQLPADSPLSLALPELPALPELVCDYNVDIPLIPPPYFCTPAGASPLNDEPASPLIPPKKSFAPVFAKSVIAAFVSLTFAIKVSKFFVFSYSTNSIGVNGSPFNSLYAKVYKIICKFTLKVFLSLYVFYAFCKAFCRKFPLHTP